MERAFGKGKDLAMPSARPPPKRCPRCDSTNTKFCYFNNYSQSQPRHLCRDCRRYWTEGGTLRNVPQGGGSHHRKVKRSRKSSAGSSSSSETFNPVNSTGLEAPVMPTTTTTTTAPPLPPVYLGEGMMALFQPFTATGPGPMMAFKQAQFSQPIQLPAGFVNIPIQAQMPPPPPPQFDPIMALPSRFGLREYQPMNSTDISQFTTGSGGTTASSGLNAAGGSGTDQDGFYWNINNQGDGGSPPRSPRRPPMP